MLLLIITLFLSSQANVPKGWCEVSLMTEKEEEEANGVLTDGRNQT